MASDTIEFAYIRPGPIMPDGLEFPREIADELVALDLIAPNDDWPGDFNIVYDDEASEAELDRVYTAIAIRVEAASPRYGFPPGRFVRGQNHYTGEFVSGWVVAARTSELTPHVVYAEIAPGVSEHVRTRTPGHGPAVPTAVVETRDLSSRGSWAVGFDDAELDKLRAGYDFDPADPRSR